MRPWQCPDPDCQSKPGHLLSTPVEGYELAPTAEGPIEDATFTHCPMGAINGWCGDVMRLWEMSDGQLSELAVLVPNTSAALIDAWSVMGAEFASLRAAMRRRAERER